MRPDDRFDASMAGDGFGPMDAALEALDAELTEAGAQARRALSGQTQPTRFFANRLRARLLGGFPVAVSGGGAGALGRSAYAPAAADDRAPLAADGSRAPREPGRIEPGRTEPERTTPPPSGSVAGPTLASRPARRTWTEVATSGEAWTPVPLEPRIQRRASATLPRGRWGLLAAATLTGAIAFAAVGAGLDWTAPEPTPRASLPLVAVDPSERPSDAPASSPALPVSSGDPVVEPVASPPASSEKPQPTATPKPTPRPTARPTPKPDPTKATVADMQLVAKACPGGVILDWTKPSPEVGHYHVLRAIGGDVPATYPAAGTTEVETATSESAGTTDGFDATIDGGSSATYRAFAFDAADEVLSYSPARTVATVGRISLGALSVESAGPGSIDVAWASAGVTSGCFTYGKLVASEGDPDPSYLKGSPYLAVVDSASTTALHLEGLPSGKTVWMRYEMIRVTSLGKFVVARTDAVQVTIP